MKKSWSRFFAIALACLLLLANAEARRGGGFSSRSFGSSRSSSWGRSFASSGSSKSSSAWGKSSTAKSTSGSAASNQLGSSKSASSSSLRKGSAASTRTAYYQKARKNNTVFESREQASQAFRQKYGGNYTNNFSQQPASRPGYIPTQTTLAGGQQLPIFYNQAAGGYGYRDPLTGGFMLYSVFRDAAMMSLLMQRNSYYYGAPPTVLESSVQSSGFLRLAVWLLIIFAAINVFAWWKRRRLAAHQ